MAAIILACDKSATLFKEPLTFCGFLVPSVQANSFTVGVTAPEIHPS
jgi:hypothetical protein